MRRLHRLALAALFVTGYPLIGLGQQDRAGHGGQHHESKMSSDSHEAGHAHMDHAKPDTASGNAELKQTTCRVSGKPIDKDVFIEYEGQKVYFCCKGCPPKFKATPNKYLPALYKQIYPQTVQVKCPVMGEPIDPKVFTDYKGQRVYFCCKDCVPKFKANPQKYLKKLPEVSTTQVHCPVSGKPIDPEVSAEVGGKTVYFCCKMCKPKYEADPSKYPLEGPREAGLLAYGKTAKDDLFLCPVCAEKGGGVHKRSEVKMVEIDGVRYAMCGQGCVAKFKQNEDKYLRILHERLVKSAGGTAKAFTCPMHPQIVTKAKGKCPICGMDLKPAKQTE
jgi:YHS domain-containing protein